MQSSYLANGAARGTGVRHPDEGPLGIFSDQFGVSDWEKKNRAESHKSVVLRGDLRPRGNQARRGRRGRFGRGRNLFHSCASSPRVAPAEGVFWLTRLQKHRVGGSRYGLTIPTTESQPRRERVTHLLMPLTKGPASPTVREKSRPRALRQRPGWSGP